MYSGSPRAAWQQQSLPETLQPLNPLSDDSQASGVAVICAVRTRTLTGLVATFLFCFVKLAATVLHKTQHIMSEGHTISITG